MKSFILPLLIAFFYSSISFAQWTKKEFVDDFGDPIGQYYITEYISNGSYSNSTVSKGELLGRIVVTDYNLYFRLFENGSYSSSAVDIDNWKVEFKAPDGESYNTGFEYGLITRKKLAMVSEWLKKYSSFKVYIEDEEENSSYNFSVNCNGFTRASAGMEFPDFADNEVREVNPVIETDMMVFYRLTPEGQDIFGAFKKTNPTIIIDSVGVYYIVRDKDVQNNARIYIKKADLKNNNNSHFY